MGGRSRGRILGVARTSPTRENPSSLSPELSKRQGEQQARARVEDCFKTSLPYPRVNQGQSQLCVTESPEPW